MRLSLFLAGFLSIAGQIHIASCESFAAAEEATEAVYAGVEMSPMAQLIQFLLPLLLILLIVLIVRRVRNKQNNSAPEELTSYNHSGRIDEYSPSNVEIFCKNCGSRIEDLTNSFCEKCGAKLKQ